MQFGKYLPNLLKFFGDSFSPGIERYSSFNFEITALSALHTSSTIDYIVECPSLKLNAFVWYESPVPKNLKKKNT